MAFESNYITMIGNLTDDPQLRFTSSGVPVVSLSLAVNRRYNDRNGQQQEETTFMNVSAWRDMAENVAESLNKGDRAVVIGRIKNGSYTNREGQTVRTTEIEADEIAPSLRWAKANVNRAGRSGGNDMRQPVGVGGGDTPPPVDADVPF